MESQPQNPEFRINPKNVHPCFVYVSRERSGETVHMGRLLAACQCNKYQNLISWPINSYFHNGTDMKNTSQAAQ